MSDPENTAHDIETIGELVILVTFPLSALLGNALWNRGTTIDVRMTTVLVLSAFLGLPVAVRTIYHWFRAREKLDPPPHWNLKQDSPGTWALVGVGSALLQVTAIGIGMYFLASLLAQHTSGSIIQTVARVTEIRQFEGRTSVCKTRVSFTWNWEEQIALCVVPSLGRSLGSLQLHVGDSVVVSVASNIFGSALVGVEAPKFSDNQQGTQHRYTKDDVPVN